MLLLLYSDFTAVPFLSNEGHLFVLFQPARQCQALAGGDISPHVTGGDAGAFVALGGDRGTLLVY